MPRDELENFYAVQASPFYFENNLPKRLKPHEVYAAIVGIFAKNSHEYQLLEIVFPEYKQERARVYLEKKSCRLHIFYYPGKDNDYFDTPESPLKSIMEEVNNMLGNKYNEATLTQAKKLFVVCESNTYYGYKIGHYIFGSYVDKKLMTEDSVKYIFGLGLAWQYDESYIDNLFDHDEKEKRQRDYQILWNDNASCGNHVIAAAKRDIQNEAAPASQVIDSCLLIQHGEFYEKGRQEINTARDAFPTKKNTWMASMNHVFFQPPLVENKTDTCQPRKNNVIDQVHYKHQPTSGCEAGLDENEREKAQHTQKYVSIFPVNVRSKMPAEPALTSVSSTRTEGGVPEPEQLQNNLLTS